MLDKHVNKMHKDEALILKDASLLPPPRIKVKSEPNEQSVDEFNADQVDQLTSDDQSFSDLVVNEVVGTEILQYDDVLEEHLSENERLGQVCEYIERCRNALK